MNTESDKRPVVVHIQDGRSLEEQHPEFAEVMKRGVDEARRWLAEHNVISRVPENLPPHLHREDVVRLHTGDDAVPLTEEWVHYVCGGGVQSSG